MIIRLCGELAAVLEDKADMAVVGQAANGQEAVELFHHHQPDVAGFTDAGVEWCGGAKTRVLISGL